jgi:hypothetical protein
MRDEKFPRKPLPANVIKPAPPVAAAPAPAPQDSKQPAKGKPADKVKKQK